ncbi:MAG: NAD(P)-dependent alcohol dehydrogenase [Rhodoferax sp.]|uniref:zinc-dependent alcohol dehydrogenase family protein n=1 Tax=Rhodoferax sp. TaxID=50421 RepID=UPI0026394107|nr:NAD(P)-dependent alcohol dehydrogenase [Rhodoferax sp.]MDD5334760.1 NAD(P)-dependent alcohol dehydrogenase [Rhodoferax sp.]
MANDLVHQWQLSAVGRQNLRYVETTQRPLGPRQVRVRVEAASLNYRDLLMVENRYGMAPAALPFTPGSDMAGTVLEVGTEVARWRGGERVISTFVAGWLDGAIPPEASTLGGPGPGMLASQVVLDAQWLAAAPSTLNAAAASTLPCAALTAWTGLVENGRLRAGQTVLIHGTGGVALFGLQLARLHGAQAIVVSGDAGKRSQALKLGARHVLERASDWPSAVLALTEGRGADHVLETVGGANLGRSLQALAGGGRVALIGLLDGAELAASGFDLMLRRAVVQGVSVGHRQALEHLVRAVDVNALQPVIAAEYPAQELPAAFDHLARGPFGKVVLTFQ